MALSIETLKLAHTSIGQIQARNAAQATALAKALAELEQALAEVEPQPEHEERPT